MNKKIDKRTVCIIITVTAIVLLGIFEVVGVGSFFGNDADADIVNWTGMAVSRLLGSVVFLTILFYLGYRVMNPLKKPFWISLLFCLPALMVVVNNLPIYPLSTGMATVNSPLWKISVLALQCFSVGLFEETCFRGVILLGFLKKRRNSVGGRLLAILFSSVVFGVVHLINVFLGASPDAVLMQIGYSSLIGAMCSVVLMKTANIWLCVMLHAVFNFCGALVPECGSGIIWEPITITLTVIIAVATAVYMIFMFVKIKSQELDRIYS